jgi:hypothetical protein
MGKMKNLVIDEMNRNPNVTDDSDWNYTNISPEEINLETGKCLWIIKSIKDDCEYRIWAQTYKEAVDMLPMIESF